MSDAFYWTIAVLLIGFGTISAASIGGPFLLVGVTLIVLRRYRADPVRFWPPLVGVVGLVLGYVLIAPFRCSVGAGVGTQGIFGGHTVCTNLLGIDYSGASGYSPALWPALLAGVGFGLVTAGLVRVLLRRSTGRRPSEA